MALSKLHAALATTYNLSPAVPIMHRIHRTHKRVIKRISQSQNVGKNVLARAVKENTVSHAAKLCKKSTVNIGQKQKGRLSREEAKADRPGH